MPLFVDLLLNDLLIDDGTGDLAGTLNAYVSQNLALMKYFTLLIARIVIKR